MTANNQSGPRDITSILADRYWLTEAGIAATDAIRAEAAEEKTT